MGTSTTFVWLSKRKFGHKPFQHKLQLLAFEVPRAQTRPPQPWMSRIAKSRVSVSVDGFGT